MCRKIRGDHLSKIEDLKIENMNRIKSCFYDGQIWTKNELSQKTAISKAGITNILKELIEKNEICFIGEAHSTGGRKSKQYQINKDFFHIGKIILLRKKDRYFFLAQTVNLLNEQLVEKKLFSDTGTLDELVTLIQTIVCEDSQIAVLCLSIPGICEEGYLSVCDFHELENTDLKKILGKLFHKKIIIENDVNVASIGLNHELAIPHLALLYQPEVEYVGCGIIVFDQLYNGFSHFAGELRYLPFYNHSIQDEMLKEYPTELLRLQIETICCVINPEMICIYSDVLTKKEIKNIQYSLPKQHLSKIYVLTQWNKYLSEGLYFMAMNLQKGKENVY